MTRLKRSPQQEENFDDKSSNVGCEKCVTTQHTEDKLKNLEIMFSSVVHEFRTPINAFSNAISLLKLNFDSLKAILRDAEFGDEELKTEIAHIWESSSKYFKICNISTTMMTNLTDDILDLSKVNAGVFELNEDIFSIKQLVEEITYVFQGQCEQKGIYFQFICGEADLRQTFYSDVGRIKQVLLNLISNSFKFTCEGGITVTLSVGSQLNKEHKGSRVLYLSVEDTGAGISEIEAENLFKPYGKASSAKCKMLNSKGTGLGLNISKELVTRMGGEITLTSQEDKGTQFRFTIVEGEQPSPDSKYTMGTNGFNFMKFLRYNLFSAKVTMFHVILYSKRKSVAMPCKSFIYAFRKLKIPKFYKVCLYKFKTGIYKQKGKRSKREV